MMYTSVLAAIVSALAADAIDNTSKQAWQKLYRAGHQEGLDLATLAKGKGGDLNRLDVDCWVYARLHSQMTERHWNALVAKFSTHKAKKVHAIGRLCPVIASHAPRLFVNKAVTAWAIPKLKGAEGKRSSDMIVLPSAFYDMNTWDLDGAPERTRRHWRSDIVARLEGLSSEAIDAAGVILLAEGLLMEFVA